MKGTKQLLWMSNIIENKKQPLSAVDADMQYVILCQRGDADAFGELVERHQKKMLNIAYRMIGDYDEACDVIQESFLAAFRAIKKFKGESLFSTWLYRIVINYTKNRLKQMQIQSRREGQSVDDPIENETGGISIQPAAKADPADEQMEKKQRDEIVQECIARLDDEFREVLVLRDIQGCSYDEISSILKIPEGTVKSRLFRARGILKDYLVRVLGDL